MIVKLSRGLRIVASDGRCFELQRLKKREQGANAGTTYWSIEGYYGSLEQADRKSVV